MWSNYDFWEADKELDSFLSADSQAVQTAKPESILHSKSLSSNLSASDQENECLEDTDLNINSDSDLNVNNDAFDNDWSDNLEDYECSFIPTSLEKADDICIKMNDLIDRGIITMEHLHHFHSQWEFVLRAKRCFLSLMHRLDQ